MAKRSAGLLLFRESAGGVEVLLAHPGGPYWARKDVGAWSIPKGEVGEGETPLAAAKREFREETGFEIHGSAIDLGRIRQTGGKEVFAWAVCHDLDPGAFLSNRFTLEWPPGSGRRQEFPEIDRLEWFSTEVARTKILRGQAALLDRLMRCRPDASSEHGPGSADLA